MKKSPVITTKDSNRYITSVNRRLMKDLPLKYKNPKLEFKKKGHLFQEPPFLNLSTTLRE